MFSFTAQRTAISGHRIETSCSTVLLLQSLCPCANQMHVVVSLGNALHVESKLSLLSVGTQLPSRTLNVLIG